jgi:hypothetical protein
VLKDFDLSRDEMAYGILHPEAVRRHPPAAELTASNPELVPTEEVLNKVDAVLPEQPWKPGIHIRIAEQPGFKPSLVSAAITELIGRGRRLRQTDGIVYDATGKVVAVDTERVKSGEPPPLKLEGAA